MESRQEKIQIVPSAKLIKKKLSKPAVVARLLRLFGIIKDKARRTTIASVDLLLRHSTDDPPVHFFSRTQPYFYGVQRRDHDAQHLGVWVSRIA